MMVENKVTGIELAEFFKNRFKQDVDKIGEPDNLQALDKLSGLVEKIKEASDEH